MSFEKERNILITVIEFDWQRQAEAETGASHIMQANPVSSVRATYLHLSKGCKFSYEHTNVEFLWGDSVDAAKI